jgi:hypothetical protein
MMIDWKRYIFYLGWKKFYLWIIWKLKTKFSYSHSICLYIIIEEKGII